MMKEKDEDGDKGQSAVCEVRNVVAAEAGFEAKKIERWKMNDHDPLRRKRS